MTFEVKDKDSGVGLKGKISFEVTVICEKYFTFYRNAVMLDTQTAAACIAGTSVVSLDPPKFERAEGAAAYWPTFGAMDEDNGIAVHQFFEPTEKPFQKIMIIPGAPSRQDDDLHLKYWINFSIADISLYARQLSALYDEITKTLAEHVQEAKFGWASLPDLFTIPDAGILGGEALNEPDLDPDEYIVPVQTFASVNCSFVLADYAIFFALKFPTFAPRSKFTGKPVVIRCSPRCATLDTAWFMLTKLLQSTCNISIRSPLAEAAFATSDVAGTAGDIIGNVDTVASLATEIVPAKGGSKLIAKVARRVSSGGKAVTGTINKLPVIKQLGSNWAGPVLIGIDGVAQYLDAATTPVAPDEKLEELFAQASKEVRKLTTVTSRASVATLFVANHLRDLLMNDLAQLRKERAAANALKKTAMKAVGAFLQYATVGILFLAIGTAEGITLGGATAIAVFVVPVGIYAAGKIGEAFDEKAEELDDVTLSQLKERNERAKVGAAKLPYVKKLRELLSSFYLGKHSGGNVLYPALEGYVQVDGVDDLAPQILALPKTSASTLDFAGPAGP